MFVIALDVSFVFVFFSIFVLGLDSSELLQRHFGSFARITRNNFSSVLIAFCTPFQHSAIAHALTRAQA